MSSNVEERKELFSSIVKVEIDYKSLEAYLHNINRSQKAQEKVIQKLEDRLSKEISDSSKAIASMKLQLKPV